MAPPVRDHHRKPGRIPSSIRSGTWILPTLEVTEESPSASPRWAASSELSRALHRFCPDVMRGRLWSQELLLRTEASIPTASRIELGVGTGNRRATGRGRLDGADGCGSDPPVLGGDERSFRAEPSGAEIVPPRASCSFLTVIALRPLRSRPYGPGPCRPRECGWGHRAPRRSLPGPETQRP